ncbi:uncharacterized GPI-anchored protein At1g61900 isoform X1 [Ananas comosus]|uniref:Uncharacterized GPI-anchored protein At1g61900 isoform X1 n=1 Tax=Ananas comosus TaxID=4615 RepID=A0A6P5GS86_ANACO|nr:uncharacterized GPI-anchored protein At1g61900 isoform X1 [Ananas comosus]
MENLTAGSYLQGSLYHRLILLTICLCGLQDVVSQKTELQPNDKFMLSDPPIGLFDPIEISPAVVPRNPYPIEPFSPMYPSFPTTYNPVLTGKCPMNFSSISDIMEITASDCSVPLASFVGNVICCPQFNSLLHIFQGTYSSEYNTLVLNQAAANDCFSDVITILASRGANSSIPSLCSVKPLNLTGGSCPVKDINAFEKAVNVTRLLDSCSNIDRLKECCRPACQPAIMEAALKISFGGTSMLDNTNLPGSASSIDVVSDCKGVVYAWLSRKLSSEAANTAFRILSGCKVNKVCPLDLKEPSSVIESCRGATSSSSSCCASLNMYIATLQKQMLITNRQAINCATLFGSMLQKAGVKANIYDLCEVDLKDFSLQAYGQQGCLLRSLPEDIVFDNVTGFSFTCDLTDNIAAPWPSSSSISSLPLCAPEMSLPALPVPQTSGISGNSGNLMRILLPLLYLVLVLK